MDKAIIFWSGGAAARGRSTLTGPTVEDELTTLSTWLNAECDMKVTRVDMIVRHDYTITPPSPEIPIAQGTIFVMRDEDGRIHKYKMPLLKDADYTLVESKRVVTAAKLATFAAAMSTATGYTLEAIKGWAVE